MSAYTPSAKGVASPKRRAKVSLGTILAVLLVFGLVALAMVGFSWGARKQYVVYSARAIPFGHQITEEDLKTIEISALDPEDAKGFSSATTLINVYASTSIPAGVPIKPHVVQADPPFDPSVGGERLPPGMVVLPFSTASVGPGLTAYDVVNLGFNDSTGTAPAQCLTTGGDVPPMAVPLTDLPEASTATPYACRLLSKVEILAVDDAGGTMYLSVTPYQSKAVRSLQAAGVQLWAERYATTSIALPPLDIQHADQIRPEWLTAPATATLQLDPSIPGQSDLPGALITDAPTPEADK